MSPYNGRLLFMHSSHLHVDDVSIVDDCIDDGDDGSIKDLLFLSDFFLFTGLFLETNKKCN